MQTNFANFDPASPDLDFDGVNPVVADVYFRKMLDRVEEGEQTLGPNFFDNPPPTEDVESTELFGAIKQEALNLANNFEKYSKYKANRGEDVFSHGTEAQALVNSLSDETLAQEAIDILTPGERTFDSILAENGDKEKFDEFTGALTDANSAKENYIVGYLLRKQGYTQEQIDSGAAEPHARRTLLKAKEDEPTHNAFLRWGEETTRELKRRRDIAEEAQKAAQKQFASMAGSEDDFEKLMVEDFPKLSDEERVLARRVRNKVFEQNGKTFSKVRPYVRKLFNTIARDEEITTKFKDPEDAAFTDMAEAVREAGKLSRNDFSRMLQMMAGVAEAHGQDVDGFFNKLGKNFTRGGEDMFKSAFAPIEQQNTQENLARILKMRTSGVTDGKLFRVTSKARGVRYSLGEPAISLRERNKGGVEITPVADGDKKQIKAAYDQMAQRMRSAEYGSEIRNWREVVASVKSDNWFVDTWVYGIARSLPEMGAAATGVAGFALVASAQTERNMAKFRRDNPDGDWNAARPAALIGGATYSALNRFQFQFLLKGMPNTRGFLKRFAGISMTEAAVETAQDLTFITSQQLTEALGADIPDPEVLPAYWEAIKKYPEMVAAMLPFGLVGAMGGKVMDHMDAKHFENLLNDPVARDIAGITDEMMADMEGMKTREKAEYLKENSEDLLQNVGEVVPASLASPGASPVGGSGVSIVPTEDGGFSVTDGETTLKAKTPEEAAEAVTQLDPDYSTKLNKQFEELSSKREENAEYLSAVESGDMAKAQEMVDEAVKKAGYDLAHRGSDPRTAQDIVLFAEVDELHDGIASYGKNAFVAKSQDLADSESLSDWVAQSDDWSEYLSEISPEDIIESAQAWDDRKFVSDVWQAQENGEIPMVDGYNTPSGAAVFPGFEKAKSADPVTYDESGNVIPLSERFNEADDRVTFSLSETSKREVKSRADLAGMIGELTANPESLNAPNSLIPDPIRWDMPLEPTLQTKRPVGHPEITKALENILKVAGISSPIRISNRKVDKNARGIYWVREKMIRVRAKDGVTTQAHEVAHALEDQILEGGLGDQAWIKRGISQTAVRELDALGNRLYKGEAPENTTMSEGFAEYFRMLIEAQHDMGKYAPEFHRWFTKEVLEKNPKLEKAVRKAVKTADEYAGQGAINQALGNIVKAEAAVKRMTGDAVSFLNNLPDEFIDMFAPIKRIVDSANKELEKRGYDKMENDPYEQASRFRMAHDSIVRYMVEEEMTTFAGNGLGPGTSLKSALEHVGKGRDARMSFTIYLWARRTLALAESKRNSGLSLEDAQFIFDHFDSNPELGPAYRAAAQKVYEWQNNVLQYLADASPDFKETVKKIRMVDPGNYIPLQREFKALDAAFKQNIKSTPAAQTGNLVKKLKGSSRRIKDPFDSMIAGASRLILRAHQRVIIEQLLDIALKVPNMGQYVFEVEKDKVPLAARSVVELMDEVSKAVKNNAVLADLSDQLRTELDATQLGDEMVTLYGEAYDPPNKLENPIIPIHYEGKRRWFEVDRTAYEALMGMEVYRLPGFWDATIGRTNRMFKLGTTGYRASFSMITNPLRDFRTLMLNTQSKSNSPIPLFSTWGATWGQTLTSALSGRMVGDTRWAQLYRRLGLEMSTPLGEDTQPVRAATRRLWQGRVIKTLDPRNVLNYIREIFQYGEATARITELKLIAKEIGFDPAKDELTPEIATKLANATKRVTTDFTASGRSMRVINQLLPFSNAQIQGVRSHVRAAKTNPVSFTIRGIYGTIVSVSLWLRYREDEEFWAMWQTMPMREKYAYTYIPIPKEWTEAPEMVRIPRAFEADGLFMALPVAILDQWYGEQPDEAVQWAETFVESFKPSAPALVRTAFEQAANRNYYFDTPIVPRSEEAMSVDDVELADGQVLEGFKHLQYGAHNTAFAIKLGEIFNVSPRRIDHAIKGLAGGAGADFVGMFGRAPIEGPEGETVERERQWSDTPVIGTIFSSVGQGSYSSETIEKLYDRYEWAIGNQRVKGKKESKEERLHRLILKDATSMMSTISEIEQLEASTKERRELRKLKEKIAVDAVKSFDSKSPSRGDFKKWEREVKELAREYNHKD